ncbi:hypothetical protein EB74_11595 [Mycobacterium sp. SWH-M5]|uniref:type VII secretion target n=1 Tax=Mycolicibacterium goodii TaxID=134601 RepID=UPI00093AF23B|nr:type VII secretion target [Mycolicibacterium goodii]MBU8817567.1 ESX-1 secretion-associated protein [Mycolicibacterium goodii]OKH63956.1 hypothetical protein EB74_11595 [Mycobacterium sp. SWH-M5]
MAELEVDPDALKARAATFREAGTDQVRVASSNLSTTESDIAAFGEINAMLHDQWRDVKARQAQSWQSLGSAHEGHGDNLTTSARGYEGTDEVNRQSLGNTGL